MMATVERVEQIATSGSLAALVEARPLPQCFTASRAGGSCPLVMAPFVQLKLSMPAVNPDEWIGGSIFTANAFFGVIAGFSLAAYLLAGLMGYLP